MIAEGRSINVTLIFSLERYRAVVEAYLSGLEKLVSKGGDPAKVASVASFFVSRVDTEVDRRLEAIAKEHPSSPEASRALALRGTAAVAQARLAYKAYLELFAGARWEALDAPGPSVSGRCGPPPQRRTRPMATSSTSIRLSPPRLSTRCRKRRSSST